MIKISDIIEEFLKSELEKNDGNLKFTRSGLAQQMNCVPSQITYVLDTRFTNNQGYVIESRRGGGGSITIRRIKYTNPYQHIMHMINTLGDYLTQAEARILIQNLSGFEIISEREKKLFEAAISNQVLGNVPVHERDKLRIKIFKQMVTSILLV